MIRSEFLGWDNHWCDVVAERLWERRSDLPHLLVVVPTAQSGRNLREALARKGGCLSPQVQTPERWFQVAESENLASKLQEIWAWVRVLKAISPTEVPTLFPQIPDDRSSIWALGVAETLCKVKAELWMAGKNFMDVVECSPEPERWVEMNHLHEKVMQQLKNWNMDSRVEAQVRQASQPVLASHVKELIIVGVTDPVGMALKSWQTLENQGVLVSVWVQAPESEREHFSDWGIPFESWSQRVTPLPIENIHVVSNERDFGEALVDCCADLESNEDVALILCDERFDQMVSMALAEEGWPVWNPETKQPGQSLSSWLSAFSKSIRHGGELTSFMKVMRHPLSPVLFQLEYWHEGLKELDRLEAEYLPSELTFFVYQLTKDRSNSTEIGLGLSQLCSAWQAWSQLRDYFLQNPSSKMIGDWAEKVWTMEVDDQIDGQWIEALAKSAKDLETLEAFPNAPDAADAIDLVLRTLPVMSDSSGRDESVMDLQGWLETNFCKQKRLILIGLHEGCVPDQGLDDPFLPQAVRKKLGLRNLDVRLAEDMHRLVAIAAATDVQVMVSQKLPNGDSVNPSKLLLQDHGESLARRVKHLFQTNPDIGVPLSARERGRWKLRFDQTLEPFFDGKRALSPNVLKDYLGCPFRCYLKHALKWQDHKVAEGEMSLLDFGTIAHDVLKQMGEDPEAKCTKDVRALSEFLESTLERIISQRYGKKISFPLQLQQENLRSRLLKFAEREIEQRVDGWEIVAVEFAVGKYGAKWEFESLPVEMRIDRIDRRGDNWRVIDYKTSSSAKTPKEAHVSTPRNRKHRRDFLSENERSFLDKESSKWVINNLQLPLYAEFVHQHFRTQSLPEIAYFNLAEDEHEIGLKNWIDYESRHEMMMKWAKSTVEAMKCQLFWPPVKISSNESNLDPFRYLLSGDGFDDVIEGELIDAMKAAENDYELLQTNKSVEVIR